MPYTMAPLTPQQALAKLRTLFSDAHKAQPQDDHQVLDWADHPELWATHQVAHRGWSYMAAESVVRQCRILRTRAHRAVEGQA
jgi:hypothetical protein